MIRKKQIAIIKLRIKVNIKIKFKEMKLKNKYLNLIFVIKSLRVKFDIISK